MHRNPWSPYPVWQVALLGQALLRQESLKNKLHLHIFTFTSIPLLINLSICKLSLSLSLCLSLFLLLWLSIIWRTFAVIYATFAVAKTKLEKNLGLYGIRSELCDTGAALYQLSEQANWGQVVELVRYKPPKRWWWSCEYMKMIYVNCGVKNYEKKDYRSDIHTFCRLSFPKCKSCVYNSSTAMIFLHIIQKSTKSTQDLSLPSPF